MKNFKQDVILKSILHLFCGKSLFYLNGKEIESLDGLDSNSTMVTCIYTDYLGNLILELEDDRMFDKEFEESLLELRDALCSERIAKYCIVNGIPWSDSAMTGSPIEVLGTAIELIRFGYGVEEKRATEKLGVLLVDVTEPRRFEFFYLIKAEDEEWCLDCSDNTVEIADLAYKCTQEEAKKYPQFRWVALEDL